MAMDLSLKITADASQAKAELSSVEKGIQRVEQSGTKGGGSLSKVMQAVAGDTSKVNAATEKLNAQSQAYAATTSKVTQVLGLMNAEQVAATDGAEALAAGSSLLTLGLMAAAAAAVIVAAGIGAVATALYESSAAYVKQSGILDYHQAALDRVSDAWERLQYRVGQAVVGSGADVTSWLDVVAVGIEIISIKLQHAIEDFKRFFEFAARGPAVLFDTSLPTPQNATTDIYGNPTAFGRLQQSQERFMDGYSYVAGPNPGKSAWDVDREFFQHQEEAAKKAKQAAADFEREAIQVIRRVNDEAAARDRLQLWVGRNTTALQEQVRLRRTELAVYAPLIEQYGYLTKAIQDERTGVERMNDALLTSARIQGGEFAAAQQKTHEMVESATSALDREADASAERWERARSAFADVAMVLDAIPGKLAEIGVMAARAGEAIMRNLAEGDVWGAVIAGAAAAVGIIGRLVGVGPTDYEKRVRAAAVEMRGLTQEAVAAAGSMARLALNAQLVGINIQGAFDSKDPAFLRQILDEVDTKTRKLNAAMQEYGFTWEDLGEKQRAAKLGDQFTDLFEKTQLLKTAGIDYSTILERQAADYSALVQDAVRTGTEIPLAMQPILEQLLETGQLIGANGEALTDLNDISWAKSLTQGFDQVTEAIYDLRDALINGVGGAIDSISGREVVIRTRYENGGGIDSFDPNDRGDGSGLSFGSQTARVRSSVVRTAAGRPVTVNVQFHQPVMANDHTSMAKFAQFVGEATTQELRRRGMAIPA